MTPGWDTVGWRSHDYTVLQVFYELCLMIGWDDTFKWLTAVNRRQSSEAVGRWTHTVWVMWLELQWELKLNLINNWSINQSQLPGMTRVAFSRTVHLNCSSAAYCFSRNHELIFGYWRLSKSSICFDFWIFKCQDSIRLSFFPYFSVTMVVKISHRWFHSLISSWYVLCYSKRQPTCVRVMTHPEY